MTKPANTDDLTIAKRRVLAALLVSKNVTEAAAAAQVSERSARRWLTEPAFVAELRRLEREAIEQATRRLTGGTQTALDAILAIMEDEDAAPGPRLRAATVWLDIALRWREINELEERLAVLEERMAAVG